MSAGMPRFRNPRYEFVSGPLCVGGFGPNVLNKTFGPSVVFQRVPPSGRSDLAPSEGSWHFGHVRIDGKSGAIAVTDRDPAGIILDAIDLVPAWDWPVSTVFNRGFEGATRQKPDATALSVYRAWR
jgi:phosphodiesterase/alkaline phosphatase D-like protein